MMRRAMPALVSARAWATRAMPALLCALTLATGAARAEAPSSSPRPLLKPGSAVAAAPASDPAADPASAPASGPVAALPASGALGSAMPGAGPVGASAAAPPVLPPAPVDTALGSAMPQPGGLPPAIRPRPKPVPGLQTAVLAVPAKPGKPGAVGSVCGDPRLHGTPIPPIPAKTKGCGLQEGVKITSVSGIRLSTPATLDCTTARALRKWVDEGIVPAVGKKGGGVVKLHIAASYACRPRNNQKGAKVSEHGRGRAVDLAGVVLASGQEISVLRGWKSESKILRRIHASACGTFGTVLGPKSDRYHQDHIHVDTARHRNGSYCK